MRRSFQNILVIPSLLSMSFYSGVLFVGETEAAFTSKISPDSIELAAAFVFPETIRQLRQQAQEHGDLLQVNYQNLVCPLPNATLPELYEKLEEIRQGERELQLGIADLNSIYQEMFQYDTLAKTHGASSHTYDFVIEGYKQVRKVVQKVKGKVNWQRLESAESVILQQIRKLEEAEKESKKDDQDASRDEASKHDVLDRGDEQVTREPSKSQEEKKADEDHSLEKQQESGEENILPGNGPEESAINGQTEALDLEKPTNSMNPEGVQKNDEKVMENHK
ncbi:DUF4047 domain-containing protein [Neobacillus mesonae]|uniref:DUF4047 domain-containing protein n=1 Tax=Neobacillus mesonae TaxID=1193713 RepID=UPI002E244DBD|nr:DUF4047 domain-containing protein [Neobacillus mesonae]